MDEANFQSELVIRKDGQTIRTQFGKIAGKGIGGTIESTKDGKAVTTEILFAGIDKANQTITMMVNGSPMVVSIQADKFEDNHFFNPTYTTTITKGNSVETVTFKLEGGQACYGYSTHLIFMIMGAYSI
jgi:hypothetical protein